MKLQVYHGENKAKEGSCTHGESVAVQILMVYSSFYWPGVEVYISYLLVILEIP
jgi:hypothetical protein